MRVLMACMQFPTEPGHSYMTTELAEALTAAGHEVEVLLLDWGAPPGALDGEIVTDSGIRVVRCAPREIDGLGATARSASKFILSGRALARAARTRLDLEGFDVLIAWAPAIAIAPVLAQAVRAGVPHRILFIWDFFPDHHRQIGRIPAGAPFRLARAWEQRQMARFTAIVCTLPGNAAYLRRNFKVQADQRVLVAPIWSDTSPLPPVDRSAIRRRYRLPADAPLAVFGGQLVEGRGFEQMLAAADLAAAKGSVLGLLFVGDGRLAPMIRERAGRTANVIHLPAMPRQAYLDLLGACDVGMAVTVPGVTSFSIPTKIIDYLRAGLPVVAAIEPGNDVVEILDRYRVGAAVPFGDPAAFLSAAERLGLDPELREVARRSAPTCLDEVFDVRHAVATVMEAVQP